MTSISNSINHCFEIIMFQLDPLTIILNFIKHPQKSLTSHPGFDNHTGIVTLKKNKNDNFASKKMRVKESGEKKRYRDKYRQLSGIRKNNDIGNAMEFNDNLRIFFKTR